MQDTKKEVDKMDLQRTEAKDKYDHILTLLGTMSDNMVLLSEKDANIPQTITEEDADKLQKYFEES